MPRFNLASIGSILRNILTLAIAKREKEKKNRILLKFAGFIYFITISMTIKWVKLLFEQEVLGFYFFFFFSPLFCF